MSSRQASLWRRRQFFLGQRPSSAVPWSARAVVDGLCLQAHPDLTVAQTERVNGIELTLIGDVVEPGHPHQSNIDVLRRLQGKIKAADDIYRLTSGLGGRWVLIVDD